MNNFFENLLNILKNGKQLILVEIVRSLGSTPRDRGAFLAIDVDNNIYGTIGGGEIEYIAIKDSNTFIKNKTSCEKEYILNNEIKNENKTNMVCGGSVVLKYTYLDKNDDSILYINNLKNEFDYKSKYYIFGAGHVGLELSKILEYLNLSVVVYDDRKEFVNHNRYSKNVKLICEKYDYLDNFVNITKDDFVIVMTNGHSNDYLVVKKIIEKYNPYYIGCIGSSKKAKVLTEMLINDGFDKKIVDSIHSPIGIRIGAETVEEIAISIASELILYRAVKEKRRKIVDKKSIFDRLEEYKKI